MNVNHSLFESRGSDLHSRQPCTVARTSSSPGSSLNMAWHLFNMDVTRSLKIQPASFPQLSSPLAIPSLSPFRKRPDLA